MTTPFHENSVRQDTTVHNGSGTVILHLKFLPANYTPRASYHLFNSSDYFEPSSTATNVARTSDLHMTGNYAKGGPLVVDVYL